MSKVLKYSLSVIAIGMALSGCDAASQMAGDAVDSEVRRVVSDQCQQVTADAGVVAGRIAEVCRCAADTYLADPNLTLDDATPQRIEEVVNGCAAASGAASEPSNRAPTEENGG